VDENGIIHQPLTLRVYKDTFYVWGNDTFFMDYDSSKNMLLATWNLIFGEIIPKSQIIKEYSHPNCANSNDGSIHLKVIGGAAGHYVKWDHGSSDLILDNLNEGTYVVSLYDSFSQQTTIDTFILINPAPLIGNVIIKDDTNNMSQGSIQLSMHGGTQPYTYLWNDPNNSTSSDIQNLSSGNYTVTVTDKNNCIWDTTVIVNNQTNSIKDQINELFIYPNPSKDGTINIKMSNPISESIDVYILDAKGQECYHTTFHNSSNGIHEAIPVKLLKGNYHVKIVDGQNTHLRKISIL
jgi:hypothetical protein